MGDRLSPSVLRSTSNAGAPSDNVKWRQGDGCDGFKHIDARLAALNSIRAEVAGVLKSTGDDAVGLAEALRLEPG